MAYAPKKNQEKLARAISAWETLRPTKSFGGMTLAQFKAKVQTALDARTALDQLGKKLVDAQDTRDDADNAALAALALVVNGVRADSAETENGQLYEAMGYVRKTERSSGLTRKGQTQATAAVKAGK